MKKILFIRVCGKIGSKLTPTMSRRLFLIVVLCTSLYAIGQDIRIIPKVDERTELMSIVFRLAGAEEYVNNDLTKYSNRIDSYFEQIQTHPIISFVQQMREQYGIGYDAVMSMAIHLQINNDSISLMNNLKDNDIDERWYIDSIPKFIELLNDFYQQSQFHDFYEEWETYRKIAEANVAELLKKIDFSWFEQYYGDSLNGTFNLIISLSNGDGNYGANIHFKDGQEYIYAIIGSWNTDSADNPVYSSEIISLIIHEFNHSFCNPLVYAYKQELLLKAEEGYQLNSLKFDQQAYGNATIVMCEILVRASVIKYFQAHQLRDNRVKYLLAQERNSGFIWIDALFGVLTQYEQNRTTFPTLRSFMPEIIKMQNGLNLKKMQKEQDKKRPVISISNIKNGAKNIDAATDKIIVHFSKPMYTGANGSTYGKKGKDFFPEILGAEWNNTTKTEWILFVKLELNREYSIAFPEQWFMSEDFDIPKNTVYLDFKTKK
ncbi:MAG: DUF4932 domain-containing protein [Bacteroidales bacterium]|jgi:hypothetical protein|nr:DUF4932 domain-containing protein [Bacteroidales bacterium]